MLHIQTHGAFLLLHATQREAYCYLLHRGQIYEGVRFFRHADDHQLEEVFPISPDVFNPLVPVTHAAGKKQSVLFSLHESTGFPTVDNNVMITLASILLALMTATSTGSSFAVRLYRRSSHQTQTSAIELQLLYSTPRVIKMSGLTIHLYHSPPPPSSELTVLFEPTCSTVNNSPTPMSVLAYPSPYDHILHSIMLHSFDGDYKRRRTLSLARLSTHTNTPYKLVGACSHSATWTT